MVTRTAQTTQSAGTTLKWQVYPLKNPDRTESRVKSLLKELSPDTPWGDRQIAAKKLGYLGNPDAVPGLLAVLQEDDFWMVRCAIIQALELIGDNQSVPILREVAKHDGFQIVRSYAAKAVERLL